VASAGAYLTAVYFTYQFLTPEEDTSELNNNNATSGSPSQCCTCYTTNPNRTQTFQKIAQDYDDQINRDELAMGLPLLRRALLYFNAAGDVLEVGAGTGRNIDYYPSNVNKVVLTDTSDQMLMRARKKIQEAPSNNSKFQVFVADASTMTDYYADDSFDTVVDTFGLCSYDDPVKVLKELRRICKPSGKILLLEHGRSKKWQGLNNHLDKHAERHAKNLGCVWNRDIDLLVDKSGLQVEKLDTWHFGTTYYIVCKPGDKADLVSQRMEDHRQIGGTDETERNAGNEIKWWKKLFVWESG